MCRGIKPPHIIRLRSMTRFLSYHRHRHRVLPWLSIICFIVSCVVIYDSIVFLSWPISWLPRKLQYANFELIRMLQSSLFGISVTCCAGAALGAIIYRKSKLTFSIVGIATSLVALLLADRVGQLRLHPKPQFEERKTRAEKVTSTYSFIGDKSM